MRRGLGEGFVELLAGLFRGEFFFEKLENDEADLAAGDVVEDFGGGFGATGGGLFFVDEVGEPGEEAARGAEEGTGEVKVEMAIHLATLVVGDEVWVEAGDGEVAGVDAGSHFMDLASEKVGAELVAGDDVAGGGDFEERVDEAFARGHGWGWDAARMVARTCWCKSAGGWSAERR